MDTLPLGALKEATEEAEMRPAEAVIHAWIIHQAYKGYTEATIRRRTWTARHWLEHVDGELNNANCVGVEQFLMRWPSAASRRAILGDLRSLYRWAVPREYLSTDPTALVDIPRRPKRLPTPVSSTDVRRLLASTMPPRRTMIALAALAGLRVSEVAALCTQDVDLRDSVLTVRNGKGNKDRRIPIAPRLHGELAGWPTGRYFPGLVGRDVSYRIRTELRRLGIAGRPHDLRAAFCTELARISGGNLVLVAELAGHESIQTTQGYVSYSQDASALVARMFAA